MAPFGKDIPNVTPNKLYTPTMERLNIPCNFSQTLTVYIQDESNTSMSKVVFLTVHDINTNHHSLVPFVSSDYLKHVRERSVFIHVVMPGHDNEEPTLSPSYEYPSLDGIAHDLNSVLDALSVKTVICIGEGAGANILCRFTLLYPNRCLGLMLIDFNADSPSLTENWQATVHKYTEAGQKWLGKMNEKAKQAAPSNTMLTVLLDDAEEGAGASFWKPTSMGVNQRNAQKYLAAYQSRGCLKKMLSEGLQAEVLLLVGQWSKTVKACKNSLKMMDKMHTTLMVVDNTADILTEAQYQVARALVLFCKGCGVLLGIPMFGLEEAFQKVNDKINKVRI